MRCRETEIKRYVRALYHEGLRGGLGTIVTFGTLLTGFVYEKRKWWGWLELLPPVTPSESILNRFIHSYVSYSAIFRSIHPMKIIRTIASAAKQYDTQSLSMKPARSPSKKREDKLPSMYFESDFFTFVSPISVLGYLLQIFGRPQFRLHPLSTVSTLHHRSF